MSSPVIDASLTSWLHDPAITLSDASRKSYAGHLRMLIKYAVVPPMGDHPIANCILNVQKSIRRIRDAPLALTSKQALVSVILAIYKHSDAAKADVTLQAVFDEWDEVSEEIEVQVKAVALTSLPSVREQAASVSHHEVLAKEQALARSEYGSMRHLVLAWSTQWGPLRGGDSGLVYLVAPLDPRATDDAGPNVLILDSGSKPPSATLVVRQHKTAKQLGAIIRPLPPALLSIVLHSLRLQPREALFISPASGRPFNSEASYTAWANRKLFELFDKPVTANTLRHLFISQLFNQELRSTSQQQLEDTARSMGHSVSRQMLYRRIEQPSTQWQPR